ncbi:MAG: 2-phospho-L-lactate guanylyltransferase [Anaerolineae bacterium]|nr:MAG: 2-phospho-L-lactate guanylyltransferase [Anaerolineae bacterium]
MTIWAIVPVKPLRLGKSRLANVLTDDERGILNRKFLEQTLQTLREMPEISQVLVVSRDPAALAIAREFGARTVLEDGNPNLNLALTRATLLARNYATRGVLVLPADLPLLTAEDVRSLLDRARQTPCVVIAPDRHQDGTNALFMNPAGLIPYSFGAGSFYRHCEAAQKSGVRLEIVQNAHIGLDLDTPNDLRILNSLEESVVERR